MTEQGEAEELTYADADVDIDASEAATAALVEAVGDVEAGYAGLLDIGDRYLALATDGVGTKSPSRHWTTRWRRASVRGSPRATRRN